MDGDVELLISREIFVSVNDDEELLLNKVQFNELQ